VPELERAGGLREEVAARAAHLALDEHERAAGALREALRGDVARGGREEVHLQLDGRRTVGLGVERLRAHAHRRVEDRHDGAAVRDVPAVHQFGIHVQARRDGPGFLGELADAEVRDVRDLDVESGGLAHTAENPPSTGMITPVM
jgi:hypothetical protein